MLVSVDFTRTSVPLRTTANHRLRSKHKQLLRHPPRQEMMVAIQRRDDDGARCELGTLRLRDIDALDAFPLDEVVGNVCLREIESPALDQFLDLSAQGFLVALGRRAASKCRVMQESCRAPLILAQHVSRRSDRLLAVRWRRQTLALLSGPSPGALGAPGVFPSLLAGQTDLE